MCSAQTGPGKREEAASAPHPKCLFPRRERSPNMYLLDIKENLKLAFLTGTHVVLDMCVSHMHRCECIESCYAKSKIIWIF